MLSFLIILSSAYIVFSSENCVTKSPCSCATSNDKVIDLSSVGRTGYPRFYQVDFTLNDTTHELYELYSYNPCYSFESIDKHIVETADHTPCSGAAACIRTPGQPDGKPPVEYMIGLQSSAEFQTENGSVYITYTVPESKRSLIVWLLCNDTIKDNVLHMNDSNGDKTVLSLVSKCACFNGCSSTIPVVSPPGLSVGSKLLIAFFTILLAYFVVGIFWNYCNGSQGVELIPNVEFWNDLPTLIMEGVSFACSCCGRQSSYGEV